MPTRKMNPLLHVALLTTGISLVHVAPASAQATVQFEAAIPPGMTEALKRYGIEIPQERVIRTPAEGAGRDSRRLGLRID